jgi:hypothetical protein
MSNNNTTTDHNISPVHLAFQALLDAHHFTPPNQLRELILAVELTKMSFCLPANEREFVTCTDEELPADLIFTAGGLIKIPSESHDDLLGDIEEMLARHAPKAFIAYASRRRLWEDPVGWNKTIGLLASHINADARHKLTAVLANEIFPEAVAA